MWWCSLPAVSGLMRSVGLKENSISLRYLRASVDEAV